MEYYSLGNRSKPALVLLHGWGIDGEKYRKLAMLLSKDYFVLVPDLPGFGKSPNPTKAYTVNDYVRRVNEWLRNIGVSKASFIGHSFGGRILIKLAHKHPRRVKSIILSGSPGIEKYDLKRSGKRVIYWTVAKIMKGFLFLASVRKFKKRFYAGRDLGKLDGVMRDTFHQVIREKLSSDVKKIKQPTLLLWGAKDRMVPVTDAEKILRLMHNSYLKIFTKAGHRLPYEKPYEFAREALNFFG